MEGVALFVMLGLLSPWLLILPVLVSIGIFLSLETESDELGWYGGLRAALVFAAGLVLLAICDQRPFIWIWFNPSSVLYFVFVYLGCAVIWGVVKWFLFVTNKKHEFEDFKLSWLRVKGVEGKSVPSELEKEWYEYVSNSCKWGKNTEEYIVDDTTGGVRQGRAPKDRPFAWDYKSKITGWMAFWPWSVLWTLLSDLTYRVFRRLQRFTADLMDAISHWVWSDVKITKPEVEQKLVFKNEYEAREAARKIQYEIRNNKSDKNDESDVYPR